MLCDQLQKKLNPFKKWWILAAMSTCLAMSFIDITGVSVSLPQIQKILQGTNVELQWVINAYLLTLSVFMIMGGRLGDIYGHRQVFLSGTLLFLLTSISCASAPTIKFLIAGRALQGFAGALISPSTSSIMLDTFSPKERGKATGIFVGSASFFLALGPLIGGVLTELVSWRLVFWVNIPFSIFSILIVSLLLKKEKRHKKIAMDWRGLVTLAIGMSSLIFALMEGNTIGWTSPLIYLLFCISLLSLCCFIWIEKHAKSPLIDFNIFYNKTYLACLIAIFCIQTVIASGVFRAIWLQDVLGFTPAIAGLLILPNTGPILFMSPLAGKLVDRYGLKLPATLGFLFSISAMLLTGYVMQYQNYWMLLPGLFLLGIGLPLGIIPTMISGLSSVELNKRGLGSGTLHAVRQMGGSMGLAVLGAIIIATNLNQVSEYLSRYFPLLRSTDVEGLLWNSPAAQQAIVGLNAQQIISLHSLVKTAYTTAFSFASYLTAIFLCIGLVAILITKNYKVS